MKGLLLIFNLVLETVYYIGYPMIATLLLMKQYLPAINPDGVDTKKGILFHASSMGEVNAIKPLINKIIRNHPEISICITTTSLSGLSQARSISPHIHAYLSVLDVPHLRAKQLNKINPGLVCIVETEIWLNMLAWCNKQEVPMLLLNARMSEKSSKRYTLISSLINSVSGSIREVHAQSCLDANRFKRLFKSPVFESGNLKYCLELPEYSRDILRSEMGILSDDFLLCWGSSRPGEEALLMSIFPALLQAIPNIKIVVALRHPERLNEVVSLFKSVPYVLYSELENNNIGRARVLVIDKLGVLAKMYALCDIAVVGGSFFDFGGHNPLEPAFYEKATIIGNYHASCKDSVTRLKDGGGIIVSDSSKLLDDILSLYYDPVYRDRLGKNAKKVLSENQHALENQYKAIMRYIQ